MRRNGHNFTRTAINRSIDTATVGGGKTWKATAAPNTTIPGLGVLINLFPGSLRSRTSEQMVKGQGAAEWCAPLRPLPVIATCRLVTIAGGMLGTIKHLSGKSIEKVVSWCPVSAVGLCACYTAKKFHSLSSFIVSLHLLKDFCKGCFS